MKKIKSLLLTVIGLLCCVSVSAYDFEIDGIYYDVTSSSNYTVEVSGYSLATNYSIVIPNKVSYGSDTYSVTSIGNSAFYKCESVSSIELPNSITSIGDDAFCSCSNLTYIKIPSGVTKIGEYAFADCTNLRSIDLLANISSIKERVFYRCRNLTSIKLPNSVNSIGEDAFYGCTNLENVACPNNLSVIRKSAFSNCTNLKSIVLPNTVTIIGQSAFSGCSSLAGLELPSQLTGLGGWAFANCINLTKIIIPSHVTSIGQAAFRGCENLENLEIYGKLNEIGQDVFRDCTSLTCVEIQGNIDKIGTFMFSGCSNLKSINIPNSVTSIGYGAFQNCYSLDSINVPSNIIEIEGYAFSGCTNLKSVQLSSGPKSIGEYAFWRCSKLIDITIPNGVISIGKHIFESCTTLNKIVIPSSLTSIGDYAFYGCSNLTSVTSYIPANKLFLTNSSVFNGLDKENCTLYVPYGAKDTYASTEGWNEFTYIVEMGRYYDLTVSAAGYATLYLDYATEIPEGVEVYTAKEVDGILLKMAQVGDVLPANTAVIVKAPAGTCTFVQTAKETSTIADNLLKGSATDAYIDVPSNSKAFVLSMVDGEVGMYPAKLTDGRFLNNANKAYLLLDNNKLGLSDEELDTSVGGAQLSLRFDFGSATGIDAVQTEIEKVIYDLYGRKVNQITDSGIYIIGGKKVYVR